MVEVDFLAADHVRIVGLCGQNWNRTLDYLFALCSLRSRNIVKYLTTVEWIARPQCMGYGRGLLWALATGHWALAVHRTFTVYRLRHRCPTARTATRPIPEGMTIFCLVALCIVAKRYVLVKNCLKKRIGNQGQRVDFLGRRRMSISGFAYTATEIAVFALYIVLMGTLKINIFRYRGAHADIVLMTKFKNQLVMGLGLGISLWGITVGHP